jgi:parallel beta-helix repeat protein
MITFTSDSPNPDCGDWLHLHPSSGSVFEYCIIEYSRAGIAIPQSTGDTLLISHNIFRHNLWAALGVESCSPTITYNDIYHSGGHQGIAIIGEGSNPLIAYNQIKHCKVGMVVAEGATPIIENNIIIDNDFGLSVQSNANIHNNSISSPNGAQYDFTYQGVSVYYASKNQGQYSEIEGIAIINASPNITNNEISNHPRGIGIVGDSSPIINHNTIINCQEGGGILFGPSFKGHPQINENNIYNNSVNIGLQPGFQGNIDATNNWWGTTEVADIAEKIHDINDDPTLGTVLYEPFLTEPVDID